MDTEVLAATKNEILAELHRDVFLTPKGMIKFVQLFIVICAFAMTTSASGTTTLTIKPGDDGNNKPEYGVTAKMHTKYPFVKYDYNYHISVGANSTIQNFTSSDMAFRDGFNSESKFYVFVGVVSFLYVILALISYGWYKKFSKMSNLFETYFTKVDFLATIILTFLWFLSVTLWSAGFAALRSDMGSPNEFTSLISMVVQDSKADATKLCPSSKLTCIESDSWSKLYGSVIFGYLCVFLYGANCWYAFKDTEWHSEPEKLGGILQIRTDPVNSPGPAGLDDVNLEAASPNDTATIQPGQI